MGKFFIIDIQHDIITINNYARNTAEQRTDYAEVAQLYGKYFYIEYSIFL